MNISSLTTHEKELYFALKNGTHICNIDPVKKSPNISWRVHIISYIKNGPNLLDVSATLSKDGSLFFGWITEGRMTYNLHPVEWDFIIRVMKELLPDFAKKVSELA